MILPVLLLCLVFALGWVGRGLASGRADTGADGGWDDHSQPLRLVSELLDSLHEAVLAADAYTLMSSWCKELANGDRARGESAEAHLAASAKYAAYSVAIFSFAAYVRNLCLRHGLG